jgi:serine protease
MRWLWVLVILAACKEAPSYRLTALLPSPALPGQDVTAYGSFPTLSAISLAGNSVSAVAVPGGLRFTVPDWAVAGNLEVAIPNTALVSKLQVLPEIRSAALDGERLVLSGSGWQNTAEVWLEVNGQKYAPTLQERHLILTLGPAQAYGPLGVRVWVNNQASTSVNLLREAGAVRGQIVLPAAAKTASPLQTSSLGTSSLGTPSAVSAVLLSPTKPSNMPGLTHLEFLPALGVYRLSFATTEAAEAASQKLPSEPDLAVHTFASEATAQDASSQWHLPLMGLPQGTPSQQVVVAVVDSGIDLGHPDLANHLPGWDFVDADATPQDTYGHGTHVAGLIAANGKVKGSAPGAKILPVRVLQGASGGSIATVAQGILWAAGLLDKCSGLPSPTCNPTPAQIINLSLGVEGSSKVLGDAVKQALDRGVIVVAASGNSGGSMASPATVEGVISVTALAGPKTTYQPWYASTGPGLQLAAYGGDTTQDQNQDGIPDGILSTDLSPTGYGLRMGTSMAAPLVSGLAALALSAGTPAKLLKSTLAHTATDLGYMGYDTRYGYGLATSRSIPTNTQRIYVITPEGHWTLVQPDLSFLLGNLPPKSTALIAASDNDADGIAGEAGELISAPLAFTPLAAQIGVANLSLSLSDGTQAITLR